MRLSHGEIISGGLFFALAGWFLTKAIRFPPPLNTIDVGPGAFPKLISVAILIMSALLIAQGIIGLKKGTSTTIIIKRRNKMIGSVVTLVLYVVSMPMIGYYLSTAICLPVLLVTAEERKWKSVLLLTVGFLLFSKVGFEMLLDVPLP